MDNLEKYLKANADEIGNNEPAEGHIERFEIKLSHSGKDRSKYWIGFFSGIAVILVIGFIFFVDNNKQPSPAITLSTISKQYAEVEFFYTSSINTQIEKLEVLTNQSVDQQQLFKMVEEELADYDQNFKQLSEELNASPKDERVISAMIEYYRTKLEIINRIVNELENKQVKNKTNENTAI